MKKLLSILVACVFLSAADASYVYKAGAGGSGVWGAITGTLTDQTDLVTALGLKAPLASPTFTGTAVLSGSLKKGNCHLEPSETDVGNSGSSQAVDLSTANIFTITLNASPTITFSNPQAGCPYAFVLTQDGTGSRTVTWAGTSMLWSGGTKTLSTAASSVDKVTCVYDGAATKLLCDLGVAYQ